VRLTGQAVEDLGAVLAGLHHSGLAQHLQVRRGVGDTHSGCLGERIDAVFTLSEQFDALRVRRCVGGPGELVIEPVVRLTTLHRPDLLASSNDLWITVPTGFRRK
jgi:hypothetical protein